MPPRGDFGDLCFETPARVEKFFRPITAHPVFEHLQMRGIFAHVRQRHLMRPKGAFDLHAIDNLGTRPSLECAQYNRRPTRPLAQPVPARVILRKRVRCGPGMLNSSEVKVLYPTRLR